MLTILLFQETDSEITGIQKEKERSLFFLGILQTIVNFKRISLKILKRILRNLYFNYNVKLMLKTIWRRSLIRDQKNYCKLLRHFHRSNYASLWGYYEGVCSDSLYSKWHSPSYSWRYLSYREEFRELELIPYLVNDTLLHIDVLDIYACMMRENETKLNAYGVGIWDESNVGFIASNIEEIHQTLEKCLHFLEVVETNTSWGIDHDCQINLSLTNWMIEIEMKRLNQKMIWLIQYSPLYEEI